MSLAAFNRKVKAYRKKHPSSSFKAAQKAVSRESKRPAKAKARPRKKKPAKRNVGAVRTVSKSHVDKNRFRNVDIQIGSVASLTSSLKKKLQRQYGEQASRLLTTKKKTARKRIQKSMRETHARLRRLG